MKWLVPHFLQSQPQFCFGQPGNPSTGGGMTMASGKPVIGPELGNWDWSKQMAVIGLNSSSRLFKQAALLTWSRLPNCPMYCIHSQDGGPSFRAQSTYNYWSTVEEIQRVLRAVPVSVWCQTHPCSQIPCLWLVSSPLIHKEASVLVCHTTAKVAAQPTH